MPMTPEYEIVAYDKDSDRYDSIVELSAAMDGKAARRAAKNIAKLVKDERLKTEDGQPYDWVELWLYGKQVEVF